MNNKKNYQISNLINYQINYQLIKQTNTCTGIQHSNGCGHCKFLLKSGINYLLQFATFCNVMVMVMPSQLFLFQVRPVSGLAGSTTGFAKLWTTQPTHKPSVLFPWLGGSTSQSLLTSLTPSFSFSVKSLTTSPPFMLSITAPYPSLHGSDLSSLVAAIHLLEECGTRWSMLLCTPTTSLQPVDPKFKNIYGGRSI